MALKYAAHNQFAAAKVEKIQVTSYVRDERENGKKFKYGMIVEWTDDARYELYRLYSDFYEFQSELEAMFPVQAGQISEKERTLPSLPSKKAGLFRSNLTPAEMKDKMQEYIEQLMGLEEFILRSSVVFSFFKPKDELDSKLRGKGKNPSLHPLSMTGRVRIEEYVAISDFDAKPKSNQLSLKKGQVVNVLVREGGWWFCETEGKSGWAPSTFLSPLEETELDGDGMVQPISEQNEGKYRAIAAFVGGEGQHSCQPGDLFLVVERDPDGWWLALKLGIESEGELVEAWIPAAYLESLDEEADEEGVDSAPEKYLVSERYSAKNEDELTLEEGVVVEVLKKNQDGWWFVKEGEKSGFFPAYNIQYIPEEKKDSTQSVSSVTDSVDSVKLTKRNVAASTTVFNKVKDFGASTRRDKKRTVRYPPPRQSTIVVSDSISEMKVNNYSRSIRSSVSSLDTAFLPESAQTPILKVTEDDTHTFKDDLQVANPAPSSEVPFCSVDETEVSNVKHKARKTALLRKKDSLRNVQLVVKQVEQKKRAITFSPESVSAEPESSRRESGIGFEAILKKQDLKIDGLKTQVSDLNLSVIQMNSNMGKMEQLLKLISKKLEVDSS